jgi:dienelactone hydrolase
MDSDIGSYGDLALSELVRHGPQLSYLARDWPERAVWRTAARAKVHELLAFDPPAVPLRPILHERQEHDGLVVEKISYDQPYGPRSEGLFMYPGDRTGLLPAIVALHDHGGFKVWGKEKIVDLPNEPSLIEGHKQQYYGGQGWANRVARRGYAVLVVDAFLFGSRKVEVDDLSSELLVQYEESVGVDRELLLEGDRASREWAEAYNHLAGHHEHLVAKTLFTAGTTWPGVFAYEDRRSVDYLFTRPEVDAARIGCGGLSGGGLRTIFLAGLDDRIRCAVCVGFMTTFAELLRDHCRNHTWMLYVPRLARYLDLPDLIALRAPQPLMVQYDEEDDLYTLKGQRDADARIQAIYEQMGAQNRYTGRFYAGPHKFDLPMQEDAFEWFDRWL